MNNQYDDFYKKGSKKFRKYEFHGHGKLVAGEKPNFFEYLKKFANKNFKVLDLGCGSGELTLKLSPFFKEIIGIDPFENYIETAEKQKKKQILKMLLSKLLMEKACLLKINILILFLAQEDHFLQI